MGFLGAILPQIGASLAGSFLNSAATSIGTSLGNSLSMGSNSSANYQQSGSSMSSAESGGSSGSWGQQGSIAGIAGLAQTALGTPTGNNANSAAAFNQQSAATANNLQTGQWTLANLMNMGSNVFGNLMSAASQASAKAYNAKQAEVARSWQQMMRQTAYQDTVKDMKAAGLNPILAASNGATSTPGSGSASISGQKYQGASSASIPSAKTATMQAMYDYGNNTSQWLDNMMETVNNAKQMGWNQEASWLEKAASEGAWSSAKAIEKTAQAGKTSGVTGSQTQKTETGVQGKVEAKTGF